MCRHYSLSKDSKPRSKKNLKSHSSRAFVSNPRLFQANLGSVKKKAVDHPAALPSPAVSRPLTPAGGLSTETPKGRGRGSGGRPGAAPPPGGPPASSSKRPKKPVVGRGRPAPTGPMPVGEGKILYNLCNLSVYRNYRNCITIYTDIKLN